MWYPSGREAAADAAVVVCTFSERRFELLKQAIASLRAQTVRPAEVIVVIDHNPSLLERARSAWPDIGVAANGGRRGLAGARNTGFRLTSAAVVLFIDDDAVADERWIETLLSRYADETVVAVGGLVEPVWAAERPRWLGSEYDWVVGCSHSAMPQTLAPVRNLIGANMSFRRSALDAIGGFHESVGRVGEQPLGCEETEVCIRLRQRLPQAVVLYDPAARVAHYVPPERIRIGYFIRRCFAEGRSKAMVYGLVGAAAVSEERRYVATTITRAVAAALTGSSRGGLARTTALIGGVGAAAAGFAYELGARLVRMRTA